MLLTIQLLRDVKPQLVVIEYTRKEGIFFISIVGSDGSEILFSPEDVCLTKGEFDEMKAEFDVEEAFINL